MMERSKNDQYYCCSHVQSGATVDYFECEEGTILASCGLMGHNGRAMFGPYSFEAFSRIIAEEALDLLKSLSPGTQAVRAIGGEWERMPIDHHFRWADGIEDDVLQELLLVAQQIKGSDGFWVVRDPAGFGTLAADESVPNGERRIPAVLVKPEFSNSEGSEAIGVVPEKISVNQFIEGYWRTLADCHLPLLFMDVLKEGYVTINPVDLYRFMLWAIDGQDPAPLAAQQLD